MTDLRQEFRGVRARLQRTKDYKFFHGWVTDFNGMWLVLKMGQHRVLAPGDEFIAEIHGRTRLAQFKVVFKNVDGVAYYQYGGNHRLSGEGKRILDNFDVDYEFVIESEVRYSEPIEPFRVSVSNVAAEICYKGQTFEAMVVDVADGGVGVDTDADLPDGVELDIDVMAMEGSIRLHAQCKNKVLAQQEPLMYRYGFIAEPSSRIDAGRWRKFIGQGEIK